MLDKFRLTKLLAALGDVWFLQESPGMHETKHRHIREGKEYNMSGQVELIASGANRLGWEGEKSGANSSVPVSTLCVNVGHSVVC